MSKHQRILALVIVIIAIEMFTYATGLAPNCATLSANTPQEELPIVCIYHPLHGSRGVGFSLAWPRWQGLPTLSH